VDIKKELGVAEGFSPRNLWFMRQFYEEYNDNEFLKQLVSELKVKQIVSELDESMTLGLLPWGHHILLMQKTTKSAERIYYICTSIQAGWSRKVLLNQLKADAYKNHQFLPKQHNFSNALPVHIREQADDILKSQYNLDFLGITQPLLERQLENRLVENIKDFILELGYGFSYIGNQYRLSLSNKEYFVDLLFFQRKLKCLVALDLKISSFEPEFAGKMNFYLNLLNKQVKLPEENPSIGIILCAEKNAVEVEYALTGMTNPIGVAEYTYRKQLPANLKGELPGAIELKKKLQEEIEKNKKK
jgi:predicted nuclease of restriction endonuclease-like (RecB) superfamily